MTGYRYDIALSFAGEQRDYVHTVWETLRDNDVSVFYDEDPEVQARHLGERFTELAQRIYGSTSRYVALFCSEHYVKKEWPFFESTAILDRARRALFREGILFMGRFDDSALPGFPRDIWYADLRKKSPAEYATQLLTAIRERRIVDQEAVFQLLDLEAFKEAIDYLNAAAADDTRPLAYEDSVFLHLNRACALSRLAEQKTDERKRLLDLATNDLARGFELVARQRPEHMEQLADLIDTHDAYFLLRNSLPKRVKSLLGRKTINRGRTGITFGKVGKGCVAPNTLIATSRGEVAIQDLRVGQAVTCASVAGSFVTKDATVTQIQSFHGHDRYSINGQLVASATQPLYSAEQGWVCPPAIEVGMNLLTSSGVYRQVQSVEPVSPGDVMIIGVDDESHTFIAAGFVCHNIKV